MNFPSKDIVKTFLKTVGFLFFVFVVDTFLRVVFGDYLQKFFNWLIQEFLLFISFGIDSFIDNFYLRVSQDYTESAVIFFLFLGWLFITNFFFYIFLRVWGEEYRKKRLEARKRKENELIESGKKTLDDIISGKEKMLKRLKVFTVVFGIALSVGIFVEISTLMYIKNIQSNFYRAINIVNPYISDEKEEIFISKFSQMKTKNDFIQIMNELKNIGKNNNIELPKLYLI